MAAPDTTSAPAEPAAEPLPSPASHRRWTQKEVRALIREDRPAPRYELIDGELLVTPAPFAPHQRMVIELLMLAKPYVDGHRLGETFISPADIAFDRTSLVQPDLFVVPPGQRPKVRWDTVKRLLLAVEVISKSSERADRVKKRVHYQRHRVGEYWIVDLKARVFEVWQPDDERPAILDARLTWRPRLDAWAPEVPPLEIDLGALFERVLGAEEEPTP